MKRIMIVDDTPDFLALVAMLLENENYRASMRSTGEGTIQLIKKQKPDLVILDVMLPDIDGIDVLRMLKEDPETKTIPVIVSTAASDRVRQEKQFLEAAGVEVLEKPFELDDLLHAVQKAIGRH